MQNKKQTLNIFQNKAKHLFLKSRLHFVKFLQEVIFKKNASTCKFFFYFMKE